MHVDQSVKRRNFLVLSRRDFILIPRRGMEGSHSLSFLAWLQAYFGRTSAEYGIPSSVYK